MFNNIVLNMSIIKLTVNHINKDILMLIDLLIDLEVIIYMIINQKMFTQFNTKFSIIRLN